MLKILQGRLLQYVSHELPNDQMDLEKAEGTEIKLLLDKYLSALLTTPKLLTVWITTNWKILKEMGIPDHLTCLLRNLYAVQEATVRTGHGTMDWFQKGN